MTRSYVIRLSGEDDDAAEKCIILAAERNPEKGPAGIGQGAHESRFWYWYRPDASLRVENRDKRVGGFKQRICCCVLFEKRVFAVELTHDSVLRFLTLSILQRRVLGLRIAVKAPQAEYQGAWYPTCCGHRVKQYVSGMVMVAGRYAGAPYLHKFSQKAVVILGRHARCWKRAPFGLATLFWVGAKYDSQEPEVVEQGAPVSWIGYPCDRRIGGFDQAEIALFEMKGCSKADYLKELGQNMLHFVGTAGGQRPSIKPRGRGTPESRFLYW
ncbi:hypothetical protein EDD85DRAFT_989049 [Armillaria nabsnona]|nr:hypothetical protein EDD85DRAFT_989049 [Armillaria nabsnona]